MIRQSLATLALLLAVLPAFAQTVGDSSDEIFADDVLPVVSITIDPDTLAAILDPANADLDVEYMASFSFESPTVSVTRDSVGFRLRGNTSRYSQKQSFKVSFNTFIPGGDWRGLEKLNLNGEHNDPSIMRSKLSWDIFATVDVPASRSNQVRLYINGEYFGLYMNVEHVDEHFLRRRFGNDDGYLFKCLYGADLQSLPVGPCTVQLGADEAAAWDDLAGFVQTVNSGSQADFERDLDVSGFLRYLAVTVLTGSWDSYWFLKNNFYLYHDPSDDRYHVIPYDYDNTFGIDWFGIDWATRDVYGWGHEFGPGFEPRPLSQRVLAIPEFRDRYTLYLKRLLSGGFDPEPLKARALALRDMTALAAEEDTYRTLDYDFSVEDWYASYTEPIAIPGGLPQHVPYGLLPFIDQRHASALDQLDPGNIAPVITEIRATPSPARPVDAIDVTARVEDEGVPTVEVEYWTPAAGTVAAEPAPDLGPDFWRAVVPALGTTGFVDVRIRASDTEGATSTGPLIGIAVNDQRPLLFLNELMALNSVTAVDEYGEADDWAEIHNASDVAVSLAGLHLTDDLANPDRWALPDVTVPAGGFQLLWLDGTPEQGPLHASFRLSAGGETLALIDSDLTILDQVSFGPQVSDLSFGRTTDGFGPWTTMAVATPGASNAGGTANDRIEPHEWTVDLWPNPFRDRLRVRTSAAADIVVMDLLGREVSRVTAAASGTAEWDGRDASGGEVPSGVYLVRIRPAVGRAGTTRTIPVVRVR